MGILNGLFRSDISNLINPQQWLSNFFGGGVSEAGVNINEDVMLSESAVWCGLSFLATNIASLPCPVLKKKGRQSINPKDHYLDQRLNGMANPEMLSITWRETCIYYLVLWGTALSIIERTRTGEVSALWPVHPDRIGNIYRKNGRLTFSIVLADGALNDFDHADILRVPGLGNGITGFSMLEHSQNSMGLLIAMRSFANLFFKNGSNMGVIFEHPKVLGEKAHKNLTRSLAEAYSGLGKSHKAMVAEEGMKVHPMGVDPDKSQLLEGRKFAITDVARWLNLPPHVLKDLSQSSYSNITQQSLELVIYTFRPLFVKLEKAYENYLLRDFEKADYSVRHNAKALMRGDDAARSDHYKSIFGVAAITPNEIRELEDMNPIEEEWADKTYLQLNLVPAADLTNVDATVQTPTRSLPMPEKRSNDNAKLDQIVKGRDRIASRFQPLFRDAFQKIVNRETLAVGRELKKRLNNRADNKDFEGWLVEFYGNTFPEYILKNLRALIASYAESMQDVVAGEINLDEVDFNDIDQDTRDYIDGFVAQYVGSSRGQLLALSQELELEDVQARLDEWQEARADKETEETVTAGMGMVSRAVILGAGYKLVWRVRGGDTCPLCRQLDGRTVSKKTHVFTDENEDFTDSAGTTVKFRQTRFPTLHKGCKCVVVAG